MADIDAPENQIRIDERLQYVHVEIVIQIRELHAERIVRRRTKIQEGREEGRLDGLLCSRNARPQKALVGRAQWETTQPAL
jgi:hypothetical protein